jgi:hypothetical protein
MRTYSAPCPRKRPPCVPFWYKSGVIYELHVRAFQDSDGDGTGRFSRADHPAGLPQGPRRHRHLAAAVLSLAAQGRRLRHRGLLRVHPMYGTLADFKMFLREAHRRGLRVITELVLNHTSDQHPWFQRARRRRRAALARLLRLERRRTNTRARASFSRTLNRPTGPGTRGEGRITGTAFFRTSRI